MEIEIASSPYYPVTINKFPDKLRVLHSYHHTGSLLLPMLPFVGHA